MLRNDRPGRSGPPPVRGIVLTGVRRIGCLSAGFAGRPILGPCRRAVLRRPAGGPSGNAPVRSPSSSPATLDGSPAPLSSGRSPTGLRTSANLARHGARSQGGRAGRRRWSTRRGSARVAHRQRSDRASGTRERTGIVAGRARSCRIRPAPARPAHPVPGRAMAEADADPWSGRPVTAFAPLDERHRGPSAVAVLAAASPLATARSRRADRAPPAARRSIRPDDREPGSVGA